MLRLLRLFTTFISYQCKRALYYISRCVNCSPLSMLAGARVFTIPLHRMSAAQMVALRIKAGADT